MSVCSSNLSREVNKFPSASASLILISLNYSQNVLSKMYEENSFMLEIIGT